MAKETTLYMSLHDQMSAQLNTIANSGRGLSKDLESVNTSIGNLLKKQDSLKAHQTGMTRALTDSSKTVKEAKKAYEELGNEVNKLAYEAAIKENIAYTESMKDLKNETSGASKELRALSDEQSKLMNRAEGSGGGMGGTGSEGSLLAGLGKAGMFNQVGSSVSGAMLSITSSAYGDDVGTMAGSVLGGAASGAALGSMVAPGIGTAVGALVGGISGAINGATQLFEKEDDYFKSERGSVLDESAANRATMMESGSDIAASRQLVSKSFEGAFGEGATDFVNTLIQRDATNPFSFDDMAVISRGLIGYGFNEEEIYRQLDAVGNVGAAGGLGLQDMAVVSDKLGAMQTMPNVTMKDLKELMRRGVSADKYIEEYLGVENAFASLKNLKSEDIYEAIMQGIENDSRFDGAMDGAGDTYTGKQGMLQAAQNSQAAAMGYGYNIEREKGIQEELDFLNSDTGQQMEDANRYIGEYEASLENLQEKLQRDTIEAIMGSAGHMSDTLNEALDPQLTQRLWDMRAEYEAAAAEENGEAMKRILSEAESIAQMAYNNSEGYLAEVDSQTALIQNVTNDLAMDGGVYYSAGYELGLALSKGISSAMNTINFDPTDKLSGAWEMTNNIDYAPSLTDSTLGGNLEVNRPRGSSIDNPAPTTNVWTLPGKAYGLWTVPEDNYPIRAHQGERLLTADQTRQMDNAKPSSGVVITGNSFSVRDESDIERIASEIMRQIMLASQVG